MESSVGLKVVEIGVEPSPPSSPSPPPEVDDAAAKATQVAKKSMPGYPLTAGRPDGDTAFSRILPVPKMGSLTPGTLKQE